MALNANENVEHYQPLHGERRSLSKHSTQQTHISNCVRCLTTAKCALLMAMVAFISIILSGYNLHHSIHLIISSGRSSASDTEIAATVSDETTYSAVDAEGTTEIEKKVEKLSEWKNNDGIADVVNSGHQLGEPSQTTSAILVSGAGSSEVNGCYLFKGRSGSAWEFELENLDGRTFVMFKIGGDWWNIQEHAGSSYDFPVHYAAMDDNDAMLPPRDGWGSSEYNGSMTGKDPMPKIDITNVKTCMSSDKANIVSNLRPFKSITEDKVTYLHELLKLVTDAFAENNIRYWLQSGTLIGAIRNRPPGIMRWDDDIDIGVPHDEFPRVLEILESLPVDCITWPEGWEDGRKCGLKSYTGGFHTKFHLDIFEWYFVKDENGLGPYWYMYNSENGYALAHQEHMYASEANKTVPCQFWDLNLQCPTGSKAYLQRSFGSEVFESVKVHSHDRQITASIDLEKDNVNVHEGYLPGLNKELMKSLIPNPNDGA